jgi:choline dehydrogenase-like flavoprotein
MLIDLRSASELPVIDADVCIVGAGAAGLQMARRLTEKGVTVCLAESGGLDFEQATQDLYRGANLGMPYYELDESRLRFFGGTVAIWGGRCAVLDPIDFEHRHWVPESGWPISRADLDPYYRQANAIFDVGEFNYENNVWETLGQLDPGFDPAELDVKLWRFDEVMERFTAGRAKDLFRRAEPYRPAPCQRQQSRGELGRECDRGSRGVFTERKPGDRPRAPICAGLRCDREFAGPARVE